MEELLEFMYAYREKYNRLLIIVGMELYEFGEPVRIIHADEENEMLTVEDKDGEVFLVNKDSLILRAPWKNAKPKETPAEKYPS